MTLLGKDRHAENQGVEAGEQPAARPEHPGYFGDRLFGEQMPGQRAVIGDHAVHRAIVHERQRRKVSLNGGDRTGPGAFQMAS